MVSNTEIIKQGMSCLLEKLGTVGTEQFISVIMQENFDYTKWQQQRFDDISSDEFQKNALEYTAENPFTLRK